MKKKLYIITLTITIWGCFNKKKSDNELVIISDIHKAEILNEILSDTIDLKLLPYQRALISEFNFLHKFPERIIEKEGELISVKYLEYLSHNLKEKDTVFLKDQIEKNKKFDLKILTKYNYQILNTCELLKKGVSHDSLSSIAYERMTPSDRLYGASYFLIEKPIFNKKMNRVCLSIDRPNSGESFVLVRKNGKWEKTSLQSIWAN
ncbi:hypothetical protein [uncultured Tenacibaculum sp.]|uniref:hypothetical protein n=1 Tax=uncultured Tenacibaculum sp. TaxID=174713 RepID=UPI002633D4C1|nr:hypothetical protein [uncultured Tenacibaculum sp.]